LGFSSFCALVKDIATASDSRLPLVAAQTNRLPPTWAAMWIDFHFLLLLLPAALAAQPELHPAPKDASAAEKQDAEAANGALVQAWNLIRDCAAVFFVLTCCSRAFAPTLAVFAVPVTSVLAHSFFARLLEHSTAVPSWTKRKRLPAVRNVSEAAVHVLLAVLCFAACMSVFCSRPCTHYAFDECAGLYSTVFGQRGASMPRPPILPAFRSSQPPPPPATRPPQRFPLSPPPPISMKVLQCLMWREIFRLSVLTLRCGQHSTG
jgi:hypothetical protein